MRHKCQHNGCFLKRHVCDFSQHDGWYGQCKPTDIDYVVERNSNILIQEWKERGDNLPTGQEILLRHWAGFNRAAGYQKFTIMQVHGYAGTMEVIQFRVYDWKSSLMNERNPATPWGIWRPGDEYETACRTWYEWADKNWLYERRNRITLNEIINGG